MTKEKNKIKSSKLPSKTSMNLYYREDKTTKPATIALYVLFTLVCLLAVGKFFIYDKAMELKASNDRLAETQDEITLKSETLVNYDEVEAEYNKYSNSYMTKDERVVDRTEVLDMLESAALEDSKVKTMTISKNTLTISFADMDLDTASFVAAKLKMYDIVSSVTVNTSTKQDSDGGKSYTTTMSIELAQEGAE